MRTRFFNGRSKIRILNACPDCVWLSVRWHTLKARLASVIKPTPKLAHPAFQLGMPEKQLSGSQILRAPVDRRKRHAPYPPEF